MRRYFCDVCGTDMDGHNKADRMVERTVMLEAAAGGHTKVQVGLNIFVRNENSPSSRGELCLSCWRTAGTQVLVDEI